MSQSYFGLQYFAVKIWLGNHRIHSSHHWAIHSRFSCQRAACLAGIGASLACGRETWLTCCREPPLERMPGCRRGCGWPSSAQTIRASPGARRASAPILSMVFGLASTSLTVAAETALKISSFNYDSSTAMSPSALSWPLVRH